MSTTTHPTIHSQTISDMVWKDAADYRAAFPGTQKRAIKEFSAMIPLLEPETVKCLRLALDRLEQLAATERDGLLIERIQRTLKDYESPQNPNADA